MAGILVDVPDAMRKDSLMPPSRPQFDGFSKTYRIALKSVLKQCRPGVAAGK